MTNAGLKQILDKKRVQQPDEKPEMFSSPKINSKLPPKMRCIQKPTQTPPVISINQQQQQLPPSAAAHEQYYRNLQMYSDQYYRAGNPFAAAHSGLPDVTINNAAMSANVANQLFNYQMQQQKFHAASNAPNHFAENADKLNFFERNLRMQQQQQQQQYQAMKQQDFLNNMSYTTGTSSFDNNEVPYSMMGGQSSFNNGRFSAPKPETPPSKPCGLWLDPVWNCDNGSFSESNRGGAGGGGGGSVDAVKGFNFHVVSPFLSFKTMFTFDNPNQSN